MRRVDAVEERLHVLTKALLVRELVRRRVRRRIEVEILAEVDGFLIEGRRHRDAALVANGFDQQPILVPLENGLLGLLDIANIVALAEVLVNEIVDIAQLQLDGGAHVIEAHNLRVVADDLEASLQIAKVVIGYLKNE